MCSPTNKLFNMLNINNSDPKCYESILTHKNFNINKLDENNFSFIDIAFYYKYYELFYRLIRFKNLYMTSINIFNNMVVHSIQHNRIDDLEIIIHRPEFNINLLFNKYQTFLQIAIVEKQYKIIEMFLAADDIDINLKDRCGRSALLYAVNSNERIFKKIIKQKNININDADIYGINPLIHSVSNNNLEFVSCLLEHKNIDHRIKNAKKETLLEIAINNKSPAMIKILIDYIINH